MQKEVRQRAAPAAALLLVLWTVVTAAALVCLILLEGTRPGTNDGIAAAMIAAAWAAFWVLLIRHVRECQLTVALEALSEAGVRVSSNRMPRCEVVRLHRLYQGSTTGTQEIFKTLVSDSHLSLSSFERCVESLEAAQALAHPGPSS